VEFKSEFRGAAGLFIAWLVLFSFASAQPSADDQVLTPKVLFDHIYIVVDSETYIAIKESDYITNTFCMYREDTVSNLERTWSGAYLHGQKTYIEIFGPGGHKGAEEGTVGLGFSTSKEGDINIICEGFKRNFGEQLEPELVQFEVDTFTAPWFYGLESDSTEPKPLNSWIMEYHPMHLQFMGIVPDSNGAISREAYMSVMNDMLAKKIGRSDEPLLFDGITAISLVLTRNELDRLAKEFAAMSYTKKVEDGVTLFKGPEITISCAVKPHPKYRIRSLKLSLSRKPESEMVLPLGPSSMLTISTDGTGRWTFGDDL
jgi:hypothetical protein